MALHDLFNGKEFGHATIYLQREEQLGISLGFFAEVDQEVLDEPEAEEANQGRLIYVHVNMLMYTYTNIYLCILFCCWRSLRANPRIDAGDDAIDLEHPAHSHNFPDKDSAEHISKT